MRNTQKSTSENQTKGIVPAAGCDHSEFHVWESEHQRGRSNRIDVTLPREITDAIRRALFPHETMEDFISDALEQYICVFLAKQNHSKLPEEVRLADYIDALR